MKTLYSIAILLLAIVSSLNAQTRVAYREAQLMDSQSYSLGGTAYLEEFDDGSFQFRLSQDYSTDPGPDVQILLSNNESFVTPVDTNGAKTILDIGNDGTGVSHFSGAYTVDVSSTVNDLNDFEHVVFICVNFGNIAWGHGSFGSVIQDCPDRLIEIAATLGGSAELGTFNSGDSYQWIDCNNANAKINGATSSNFTPLQPGSYAVVVNNAGCLDTSDCFEVISVGISENTISSQVDIYPNPTSNNVVISLGDLNVGQVELTNSIGQTLIKQNFTSNSNIDLTLENYSKGVYFLRVSSNNETYTTKITKR